MMARRRFGCPAIIPSSWLRPGISSCEHERQGDKIIVFVEENWLVQACPGFQPSLFVRQNKGEERLKRLREFKKSRTGCTLVMSARWQWLLIFLTVLLLSRLAASLVRVVRRLSV